MRQSLKRRLIRELSKTVVDLPSIHTYVQENLEHPDLVPQHGSPRIYWSGVLERAVKEGRVASLVGEILGDYPGAHGLRVALQDWHTAETVHPTALDAPASEVSSRPYSKSAFIWGGLGVALLATLLSAFAFRRPMPVPGYVSTAAEVRMLAVSTQTQFAVPVNQLLVPVGSFRPGSPNTASILPLCASVDGDTDACARWLAREAPTGTQQVAEFWLDRVEVSNQEFVSWVNELNGPLRGAEAGAALLRGDRLLWRQTQDYSALRLDASGAVPKLSVDTASATLPVVGVTWYAANEYCTAHAARLPTATEWEYAARGPAASEYVWSEAPACEAAAYGRVPVGRQSRGTCGHLPAAPNSTGKSLVDRSWCGVLDLGTNVSEWVNDAFVEKASSEPATHCVYASPENLGACHVIKGGSFADPLFVARPASVTRGLPETVFPHVGFRCAKSIGS